MAFFDELIGGAISGIASIGSALIGSGGQQAASRRQIAASDRAAQLQRDSEKEAIQFAREGAALEQEAANVEREDLGRAL